MFLNKLAVNLLGLYQQVLVELAMTEFNINYYAGQQSEGSSRSRSLYFGV
jgi:hypothetical protein